MAGVDAPSRIADSPVKHGESEAVRRAHKMHEQTTPASSSENKEIARGLRPDTAKLHDFHIDDHSNKDVEAHSLKASPTIEAANVLTPKPGTTRDHDGNTTEVKQKSEGGYTEVTRDKTGNTTYSKSASGDGSFTDMRTAPDGTMTATEQDSKGNSVKHIIGDSGITTRTHKLDGEGGYTDTTSRSDGTQNIHEQKANGDFKDSDFHNGKLDSQKIRIINESGINESGGYSEYTSREGKTDTKTFDARGNTIPNPAPDSTKPSPVATGIDSVKDNGSLAKKAGEYARDAGTAISGLRAVTKSLEAIPQVPGGVGTTLGLIGRAAQVGGTTAIDANEGKKEAIAVGVGTAFRYGLGGGVAAASMGLAAPEALAIGTGAGSAAETCTRDALHGKNCGEEYLQWQHDNFMRASRDWAEQFKPQK